MSTIRAFVMRHAVPAYFAVTFAISWGGLLAVGGLGGISGTTWQSDPRLPFLVLAMLAGPSIAGLLLTALVSGREGLREMLYRLLKWRIDARWYAVALLTAPLVFITVHFGTVPRLAGVLSQGGRDIQCRVVPAVRHRGSARRRHLRGTRMDGFRNSETAGAFQRARDRPHRGRAVGRVAPADERPLDRQDVLRRSAAGRFRDAEWTRPRCG